MNIINHSILQKETNQNINMVNIFEKCMHYHIPSINIPGVTPYNDSLIEMTPQSLVGAV